MATYRIRKCDGNRDAWMLVKLRDDGTEIESNGGWTTAYSLDNLLKYAGHLRPQAGDIVELVPDHVPAPVEDYLVQIDYEVRSGGLSSRRVRLVASSYDEAYTKAADRVRRARGVARVHGGHLVGRPLSFNPGRA